eukprot:scaffold5173_cov125-Isochrysis_galbana.AAC.13
MFSLLCWPVRAFIITSTLATRSKIMPAMLASSPAMSKPVPRGMNLPGSRTTSAANRHAAMQTTASFRYETNHGSKSASSWPVASQNALLSIAAMAVVLDCAGRPAVIGRNVKLGCSVKYRGGAPASPLPTAKARKALSTLHSLRPPCPCKNSHPQPRLGFGPGRSTTVLGCRRVPCRKAGLRCGRGQVLVVWRRSCRERLALPGFCVVDR